MEMGGGRCDGEVDFGCIAMVLTIPTTRLLTLIAWRLHEDGQYPLFVIYDGSKCKLVRIGSRMAITPLSSET